MKSTLPAIYRLLPAHCRPFVLLLLSVFSSGCATSNHTKQVHKGIPAGSRIDIFVDASVWRESYSTNRLSVLRHESEYFATAIVSGVVVKTESAGFVVGHVLTAGAVVNYGRPYEVGDERVSTNAVVMFPPIILPESLTTEESRAAAGRIMSEVDRFKWTLDTVAPKRKSDKSPRIKVVKPDQLKIDPQDLALVFGENRAPVIVFGQGLGFCRRPNTAARDAGIAVGTAVLTAVASGGTVIGSSASVFPWAVKIVIVDGQTGEILFADNRRGDRGFSPDVTKLSTQADSAEWMLKGSHLFPELEKLD